MLQMSEYTLDSIYDASSSLPDLIHTAKKTKPLESWHGFWFVGAMSFVFCLTFIFVLKKKRTLIGSVLIKLILLVMIGSDENKNV